jgi:hypothetical protein
MEEEKNLPRDAGRDEMDRGAETFHTEPTGQDLSPLDDLSENGSARSCPFATDVPLMNPPGDMAKIYIRARSSLPQPWRTYPETPCRYIDRLERILDMD